MWVRDIFLAEQRILQGASNNLVMEMRRYDRKKFFNYLRMMPETFDHLLSIVQPYIIKQDFIRTPIDVRTRLEITIRYLASGESMTCISYSFRVGKQTVSNIVSETCEAIWQCLKDQVFVAPSQENWKKIAIDFQDKWQFKNCIGAIDGKHISVQVKEL